MTNWGNLKNIYKTNIDIDKAIRDTKLEIFSAQSYNTPDSKKKVLRLKLFLEELEGTK